MKKFWKKSEGFTLVELIVVIAILGILAGVGTVGYSGYIKKANMAADEQLASGIANALQLHAYGNVLPNGTHCVVMTDQGITAEGEADAAMKAVYGAAYSQMSLQYNNWYPGMGAGSASISVLNSTYVTQTGTTNLLSKVQKCTTGLSEFAGSMGSGAYTSLRDLLDTEQNDDFFTNYLKDAGYDTTGTIETEALANATVFSVADYVTANKATVLDNFVLDESGNNYLDASALDYSGTGGMIYDIACWYASLEALSSYMGDDFKKEFGEIEMSDNDATATLQSMTNAYNKILEMSGDAAYADKFEAYYAPAEGQTKSQAEIDAEAFVAMMSTVKDMKGDYASKDALGDGGLMTGGSISTALESYVKNAQMAGDAGVAGQVAGGTYEGSSALVYLVVNNGAVNTRVDMKDKPAT